MTLGGWIIMIGSVGFVVSLFFWCIYKVITTPGSTKHLHTHADIEPPDTKDNSSDGKSLTSCQVFSVLSVLISPKNFIILTKFLQNRISKSKTQNSQTTGETAA